MEPQQGRPLGSQYVLDDQLGQGTMGQVWRGHDRAGHPYAFKLLHPGLTGNSDLVRRFFGERAVLTSIAHPNVVAMHDLVVERDTLAIVMDLVDGSDLRHYLRERGALTPSEACRLGAQVADGLAAIHAAHVIHRDVKPENVLLTSDAEPVARLTDFGVAKVIDESDNATDTMVVGTPRYMAPEIAAGDDPVPASDLYSLGLMLIEMLSGISPFAGISRTRVMQWQMTHDPGRPAGMPEDLWQLVTDLVGKDPTRRPAARLVAAALRDFSRRYESLPAAQALTEPPPPTLSAHPYAVAASYPAGVNTMSEPTVVSPLSAASAGSVHTPWEPGRSAGGLSPAAGTFATTAPAATDPGGSGAVGMTSAEQSPRGGRPLLTGILIGLLSVSIVALLAYYFLILAPSRHAQSSAAPPSSTVSSQTPTPGPSTPTAPENQTTPSASTPPPSSTPPTSAPTATTTEPKAAFPPDGANQCPGNDALAVNAVTSCPFAENVAAAYASGGLNKPLQVYSPTTASTYTMTCTALARGTVQCLGGTNAAVYLRV